MKRPLRPEEKSLWGLVAATVHPLQGRAAPRAVAPTLDAPARVDPTDLKPVHRLRQGDVEPIEPNRRHRISKEREEIGGRIDLHGLTQERAQAALERFVESAWNDGCRAILVITGKGVQGDGVLRRRAPDWLGAAHLSHMVAGISEAHRRHGGAGALYVALKRKSRS